MREQSFIGGVATGLLVFGIYSVFTYLSGEQPFNRIPTDKKIEQGYVRPSQLEIELKDIDGNGTNETLLKYGEKSYLLKLDEQGRPSVQAYEIQPAQIITE
ncbi:hypothetical protein JW711_06265 [Candidatus Woesearchaeota archaeon]|nr:hypothetical protein [Candidatus Woesearchaeota archaeon]